MYNYHLEKNLPHQKFKKNQAINLITNFMIRNNMANNKKNIIKDCRHTKKFLNLRTDVLITKADKGNSTVLL